MSICDLARIFTMEAMMSIATSFSSSKQALRRGAFALAVAGLAAIAPVATPAFAQQVIPIANTVDANTDCSKWKPGELMADTECKALKLKAIEQDLATQQATNGCLIKIKSALDAGKTSQAQLRQLGLARGNACSVLEKLQLG